MSSSKTHPSESTTFNQSAAELHDPAQILKEAQSQKRPQPEQGTTPVKPRTPTEQRLAEIWLELLRLDQIGIHDDFFALGGDSILATQVLSRVRETFQIELPPKVLFTTTVLTVAELARLIEEEQIKHAGSEDIAAMLKDLEGLSDEEARNLLAGQDK